jgi:phosphoserine phosphatase RsbU/P
MTKRLQLANLLFIGLTVLILTISAVSFVRAFSWINRPFPGFLLYPFLNVGSFSSGDWPGKAAGVEYLDRILAVDGRLIQDGKDVLAIVSKKPQGTMVNYLFESRGARKSVFVPVAIFSVKDFLLIFFIPFFAGLLVWLLGFIVYLLKPKTSTSWVFLILCCGIAVYGITGFEIQSTYLLLHFNAVATVLFPALFFHLGLIFPHRKALVNRSPALEYIIYLPALILFGLLEAFFITHGRELSWMPDFWVISSSTRVFTLFCALSMIAFVIHSTFTAPSPVARQRARMILFGLSVAFIPPAVLMLGTLTVGVYFPFNLIPFFVIFFPASIAYSIVRHNLFEADAIIRRTIGYAVVTVIVIGLYSAVSVTLNVFVGQYELAKSQAFPILFTFGVILIFNPLKNRVQSFVDRVFFRKEYDAGQIIDKIGGAITSLQDLGQILKSLTQTFITDMFVNTSSVMLLSPGGSAYQVLLAEGEGKQGVEKVVIDRESPIVGIIEKGKKELTRYDVLEDPKYKTVSESCGAAFEALNAMLMVPLVFRDRLIGLLTLGEKKSGKIYNQQDLNLLHTIARQGAVAIENARLFQENLEKQRMEEELNIARDLQMSMLPAVCPQIEGFQIAAVSLPAREVGGDFYDFIEMGEGKVGLIVGDVTGKSVSGALVMAAARSVYRMLSEEGLSVDEIMSRANRRAKKDMRKGMFVALLYALLDAGERSVTLCSAGQTQPIHFSAKEGRAILVQTEGDTLPIGIVDEVEYKETRLELAPGDMLVFYTDGIVEAMNNEGVMFGFERLLDIAGQSKDMSAEQVLRSIMDKVKEFSDGAVQHDDLTLIVTSVER